MAVNNGEIGEGIKSTEPLYEGTFTRRDVETNNGTVEGGGTWAAQFDNDDIEDGFAYVKVYTGYTSVHGYQKVATSEQGDAIKGRVLAIEKRVPTVSANGGTSASALATDRRGTVEKFVTGQRIRVKVDGSGTAIAIGDKLSVDSSDAGVLVQDNTNGAFYALEPASTAGAIILVEVIDL